MSDIIAVRVPKWGLSMSEGTVVTWHKVPGETVRENEDLVDIETTKITNVATSPGTGILRRITVPLGETLPVGALIGVIADAEIPDSDIDAFVTEFNDRFGMAKADEAAVSAFVHASIDSRLGPVSIGQRGDGSGDTVVLLHGFASDMNSWGFNLETLGEGRTVVAIDLPGHGSSTKAVGDGSIGAVADAVVDVLDRLEVERVHLVGHSLGAAIALKVAEALGDRLGKVVLIAPAGLPGGTVSAPFLGGLLQARRQRELKSWLEMLFADPSRVTHDMVEDVIRFKRVDGVMEALEAMRDRIVEGGQFAGLGDIVARIAPTIIAGAEDKIVRTPDMSGVRIITGAGHMPHVEAPNEVNALLAAALG